MRAVDAALQAHLNTGATTLARAWIVRRQDGWVMGFTDHDRRLVVDGVVCEPSSGMDPSAIHASTGLSVDNSAASGALSSAGITDLDIETGKFDGAEVWHWLVNWANPAQSLLQFRGTMGEIRRGEGAFEVELRGLAEVLNRPVGRTYMRQCSGRWADTPCGTGLEAADYQAEDEVDFFEGRKAFELKHTGEFAEGFFLAGGVEWLSGLNAGATGVVRIDRRRGPVRIVELWEETRFPIAPGDRLRLVAGCETQAQLVKEKLGTMVDYRGFPHMPGEDWSVAYPVTGTDMDGGSRQP